MVPVRAQALCRFARQRWRAWIETSVVRGMSCSPIGSPVSDGGRGLKLFDCCEPVEQVSGFARQRWRAWIETTSRRESRPAVTGSPVSDGGRGLKLMAHQC